MHLICSDLEGIWIPEVWVQVALKTGVKELKVTTREIKDYDELMSYRLKILQKHHLSLTDIQEVIRTMEPKPGAFEMIKWLQSQAPLVLVSDTFQEFARPFMEKLDFTMLLCHSLETDEQSFITNYILRQKAAKKAVVEAFQQLKYQVIAFGDSYNDISMLRQADQAFLFCPPDNVIREYPQFPVANNYDDIKHLITNWLKVG